MQIDPKLIAAIEFVKEWYTIPFLLVYTGVILAILIENGKPSKTIAWILVIVFLPVVGIVLYFFFGQKFEKVRKFRKKNIRQQDKLSKWLEDIKPQLKSTFNHIKQDHPYFKNVFLYLQNQKNSFPTLNNKVELLINGEQKFKRLFEDIEKAKHHIFIEYYIFEYDKIGKQLLNVLTEKLKEGLEVRIIVDSFGSKDILKIQKRLTNLGVKIKDFLPVRITSLANSNYRNHRKIVIIDGYIGYLGGINISDKYINTGNRQKLYWRDTSVRIEGDAIQNLQINFWGSWIFDDGEYFKLTENHFVNTVVIPDEEKSVVGFTYSVPGINPSFSVESMILAINSAKKSIELYTPYFVPSEDFLTALQIAASTGIRVTLILPKKGDSYIVQHASFSYLKPLLERGIHVYMYKKGFMHAKTICIDKELTFIGTVNLDSRSFYINFEISSVIANKRLGEQMHLQFLEDLSCSERVYLKTWKGRNPIIRGFDSICRLLAPLL